MNRVARTIGTMFVGGIILSGAMLGTGLAEPGPASTNSNWPGWRGGDGSGVSNATGLPVEWSETKNIQWKSAIPGRGHSSPIVWGNRIFLTTAIEGDVLAGAKAPVHMVNGQPFRHPDSVGADKQHTLKVICLDRDSGKILWEQTAYAGAVYDDRHRQASYASPTPVTDGKSVFAFFGSEGLYAYDFSGKQIWKVDMPKIGSLGVGIGVSPILFENTVILQVDIEDGTGSFIAAYDKKTGKEVWKTPRKIEVSWCTPVIARTGNRTELIASGNEFIISYDPATGKELWKIKGLESNAIHTPMVGHGMVYVTTGSWAKRIFAIKLDGKLGPDGAPEIAWKYDRGTAYVASPVLYGDYLYLTTDKGILTCLDAKTGEVKYTGGRVPVPASFTSPLTAYDGKIFQLSEDGDTFVIKAGPEHQVLGTNPLGEPIYSSPALADGKVFIRGMKNLYCISAGSAAKPASKKM
ncbi:MAG: PQQ-binding-like beta-propeller repeat protein [Acidobacteria bacterium]|nr:PQQ-binding-like beta-propeller repeat protein [Acidobacteriota bacterium]